MDVAIKALQIMPFFGAVLFSLCSVKRGHLFAQVQSQWRELNVELAKISPKAAYMLKPDILHLLMCLGAPLSSLVYVIYTLSLSQQSAPLKAELVVISVLFVSNRAVPNSNSVRL